MKAFIEVDAGTDQRPIYNEQTLEYIKTKTVYKPYPYAYGFLLNTISGDGAPLDCYIITTKSLNSGDIVEVEPVGMVESVENGEEDHKILCQMPGEKIIIDSVIKNNIRSFGEHYFDKQPDKQVVIGRFLGYEAACKLIGVCKKPLVKSTHLSKQYHCNIYLKPEWLGPTGSHKDKWAKVAIQLAVGAGAKKVVVISSGNQGLALAAQAFGCGIECAIITSPAIRPVYLDLYKKYQAVVLFAEEGNEEQAFEACVRQGYYPLGMTHEQRENGEDMPGIEGYKVSALEIVESLHCVPDMVIFPAAYCDHSQGVLRGFEDLFQQGQIQSIPQFILARAKYPEADLAASIATDKTTLYVTDVLRKTNGQSFFFSNQEMLEAQDLCLQTEGYKIELSSAAAVACLKKLTTDDLVGKTIVVVLTALER